MDLLEQYNNFILNSATQVSSIESSLRTLTFILPGRFNNQQIASESLYSALQLLSLYHDGLLAKALTNIRSAPGKPTPSPHNRYTYFWMTSSSSYRKVALIVTSIQAVQLLVEMIAKKRYGERGRWSAVVALESVKVLLRHQLLRITNSRLSMTPPQPVRDVDPQKIEELVHSQQLATSSILSANISELSSPDAVNRFLMTKVILPEQIRPAQSLVHRLSSVGKFAEYLYILRPLIYAVLMRREALSNKKKTWTPWLLSLSIEYAAQQLAKRSIEINAGKLTGLEKDEIEKRGWNMGWYALRGAFYDQMTKPLLDDISKRLEKVYVLNLLGSVIKDYQNIFENYLFSTSSL